MPPAAARSAIDYVAQRLSCQFTNLDATLVARVVRDTYRHFDSHPGRDVVPILVQDAARDRCGSNARRGPARPTRSAVSRHMTRPGGAGQLGSARPMPISVTNSRIAASNATMSSRSGSSGCTAGNCSANNSSSPIRPRRLSGDARRQLPSKC